MAEERHDFVANFKTTGVDTVLGDVGRIGRGFGEVFEALQRLSRTPELNINASKATASLIAAGQAVEKLEAAYGTTAEQLVAKDRELSKLAETNSSAALARAQERLNQIRINAEKVVLAAKASVDTAVNRVLTSGDTAAARTQNTYTPERINQLLAPSTTFNPNDASAVGRLLRRAAELQQQEVVLQQQIIKAREEALAGLVPAAEMDVRLRGLAERRDALEQDIVRNLELQRIATGNAARAQQKAAQSADLAALGPVARQRADFLIGFRGQADNSYAQQIGQAFKFSLFYGTAYRALFALTQTLQQTLQEGIEFRQGMTDLAIASGKPRGALENLGERLATIAAETGAAPSQGPVIGARSLGLFGATSSSLQDQERVAEITTRVVSRLSIGSGKQPLDLLGDVGAITQALGLGVAGTIRVADLDAYLTKRFGAPQGSTLEAVATSASVGKAAGFTDEQLFAIAANLIAKTGQSSTAVGGFMAQIFSRGGEGSLTSVAGRYGIDTQQPLANVAGQLAEIYKNATPAERAQIAAAFGRGKVQNAAIGGFLGSYGDIIGASSDAQSGASGAADKQFTERMKNIGGQIAILGAQMKEFAHLLGEAGVLDLLGVGVVVLTDFLQAVNAVVGLFNEMPHALRDFIIGLALASVATRTLAGGGLIATGAKALTAAGIGRDANLARLVAPYGAGAGAGAAGGGLGAAAGTVAAGAAVAGLLVGVASLLQTAHRVKGAADLAAAQLSASDSPGGFGSSPSQFRAQADALTAIARENRNAVSGFTGLVSQAITLGHANDASIQTAKEMEAEATRLRKVADAIEKRDLANVDPAGAFATFDKEGIQTGLAGIAAKGGSAVTQLDALTQAIFGLGKQAADTRGKIIPGELATGIGKDLFDDFGRFDFPSPPGLNGTSRNTPSDEITKRLRSQLSGKVLEKRLADELSSRGITDIGQLDAKDVAEISAKLSKVDFSKGGLKGLLSPEAQTLVTNLLQTNITKALDATIAAYREALSGTKPLTAADATSAADEFIKAQKTRTSLRSNVDFEGRLQDARQTLKGVRRLRNRVNDGGDTTQLDVDIAQAKADIVDVQIEQLEAQRKAAVANSKTQKEATRRGRAFVAQEIRAIIAGGGTADQLAGVLATAGKGAVALATKEINEAIQVALAANKVHQAIVRAAAILSATLAGPFGAILGIAGTVAGATDPTVAALTGLLGATSISVPDLNADTLPGGSTAEAETAAEKRAARLAAQAARRGGEIASARAAIASARAELQKATKGSVAYYNALASLYQAQDQLTEALRNYRHLRAELRIDNTDPVAEALLAVREAQRKLRSDRRRGKAPDVLAQDQLDVKNAQTQLEAEKFQQRLSDVQTAEELGRISHGAYIRYLESEHNRLAAISKRTRQQQDELDQIDKLLKDAQGELAGQFNIGDIKLPTPYEVRRYVQSQVSSVPFATAGAQGGTTTIYINGADTGAVRRIIDETVGKGTRVLTTTTRRT